MTQTTKYTFEKHAPMCTLGVGGKPLDIGWGFAGSLLKVLEEDMVEALSIPVGEDLLFDRSLLLGGALGELSSMKKKLKCNFTRKKIYKLLFFFCFQGKFNITFFLWNKK